MSGQTVTVAAGQVVTGINFGLRQTQITGTVWNDTNGNGMQDAGESGLAGQTVYLDLNHDGQLDAGDPSTTTAADGSYAFTGVMPGNYTVSEVLPSGWGQTTPNATMTDRLFATTTDGSNQIEELNSSNGAVLNEFTAPAPVTPWTDGLAYDGTSLYFVGPWGSDQLWQLDPNTGAVLGCSTITGGSGNYSGLAALDGKIYIEDSMMNSILMFDPSSGNVTRVMNIGASNPGLTLQGGIAAIHGPDTILAVGNCGGPVVVEISPSSGSVTHSFATNNDNSYYGIACIEGQIYLGYMAPGGATAPGSNEINIYRAAGCCSSRSTRPPTCRRWAATT